MPSLLYREKFNSDVPLTGLFIEHLGIEVKKAGSLDESNVYAVVSKCLTDCDLVEGKPQADHVISVIKRLNAMAEKEGKEGEEADQRSGKGKFFAGYLTSWAADLKYAELCLYAADYDYHRSRRYYEEVDQQSVTAIAHDKLRFDFERARIAFEAALFGFGGGYGKTPKEGENVIDLTTGGEQANRALEEMSKGIF